jgi:hypothetical protein
MTRAAAPSLIDELVGGGDAAVAAEGRAQGRDLGGVGLQRLLVGVDDLGPLAADDGDRGDLGLEGAALDGRLGLGIRPLGGVVVHGLAAELVGRRRVLGEGAHQLAGRVGVFQTVQVHAVPHLVVADAGPARCLVIR